MLNWSSLKIKTKFCMFGAETIKVMSLLQVISKHFGVYWSLHLL